MDAHAHAYTAVAAQGITSPIGINATEAAAEATGHRNVEGMKMMMMQMYFTASTHVTLWLKEWHTGTPIWYVVSLVGLLGLALLQEALCSYRAAYFRQAAKPSEREVPFAQTSYGMRTPTRVKLLLTLMYAVNVTISYLLMLAIMTYNVGYFIAIVLGLAAGHLLFFSEASATAAPDACCAAPLP